MAQPCLQKHQHDNPIMHVSNKALPYCCPALLQQHLMCSQSPISGSRYCQCSVWAMQVYFTLYEQLKTSLSYRARDHDWIKQPAIHMGAACGAGAATLAFGNPLFVVKTRLQTQHMGLRMGTRAGGPLYKGTFDALTRIAREEGVAGLYRWEHTSCHRSARSCGKCTKPLLT